MSMNSIDTTRINAALAGKKTEGEIEEALRGEGIDYTKRYDSYGDAILTLTGALIQIHRNGSGYSLRDMTGRRA
jgi:hypothetical protein